MSNKYALSNHYDGFGLLEPFFESFFEPSPRDLYRSEIMKADVKENEKNYEIEIDVPSIKKEDIKLELDEGYLTIKATRNYENKEEDKKTKYVRRERFTGSYSRSFYVGDAVEEKDITAKLENGTLVVRIAKVPAKEVVKKTIQIG